MDLRKTLSQRSLGRLLAMSSPDPSQQKARISLVERDLGLAVKGIVLAILFYFLYWSNWVTDPTVSPNVGLERVTWSFAQRVVQYLFLFYLAVNIGVAFVLLGLKQVPFTLVQWTVFTNNVVDALFLGSLLVVTGGIESSLYWLYLALIVRNSVGVNATLPQLLLNTLTCFSYGGAVLMDLAITRMDAAPLLAAGTDATLDAFAPPTLGWRFALRLLLLFAVAGWCWCLQVLLDRERRRTEEQSEIALRREQLEASGRLAAEIAHQLKNPLAIINNASYTLQRTVKEGKTITQQIQIIREEVAKSDRLITELMGYAKLTEGRVERIEVREELERALHEVFPAAVHYDIQIHRDYASALPALLAQRNHIAEIFINLMQNAREAMKGRGNFHVSAQHGDDFSIVIALQDDGPGIPPEARERIFEPYFTTREEGSGLGLAIVKHNIELYGGRITVESELGMGSRFILTFPAKTLIRLRR